MKIKDKIKKKLKPGKKPGKHTERISSRTEKDRGRERTGSVPADTKNREKSGGREYFEPEKDDEFLRRKQMILALMNDKAYVPMKMKELAILLDIPKEQRRELKSVLDALLKEGQISLSAKGKLGRPETFALTGIFTGHSKGFGFVTVEGREKDVFIPGDRTGGAMHGDKVQM